MLIFFALNGASYAGSDLYVLIDDQTSFQDDATYFQHGTPISNLQTSLSSEGKSSLDMGFLHKYLGYGTLLLAGVAAVTGSEPFQIAENGVGMILGFVAYQRRDQL